MASKSANQRRHEPCSVKGVNVSVRQEYLSDRGPRPEHNRVSAGLWKWLKRLDLTEQEDDEVLICVTPPQTRVRVSEELLEGHVEAFSCSTSRKFSVRINKKSVVTVVT